MKPPAKPPRALITAFQQLERVEDIAILMSEEDFDAVLIRVLSAWEKSEQCWRTPKDPQPDDGRPTATAWRWLVSGWELDYGQIAAGANISRDTARDRVTTLIQARLIYPDGSMSAHARKAIKAAVAVRLKAGATKAKKNDPENAN